MSLEHDLLHLLRLPTGVPAGAIEPDADVVAAMVNDEVLPLLPTGAAEIRRHRHGDAAIRFGPSGDDGLVILTYIVAQHGDPDDTEPDLSDRGRGPWIRGRGAAQCKGALAAAIASLDSCGDLARPVWLAINTEGSSSHRGSERIFADLGVTGRAGIVLTGTGLAISRANRGRVDVVVRIGGVSCHSSQPELGDNPIDRLPAVLNALDDIVLAQPDADLGPATVTPFSIRAEPVAPHTIPRVLEVRIDRRLLPGETPDCAVTAINAALTGIPGLQVSAGSSMLPASVPPDSPVITALAAGIEAAGGSAANVVVSRHTFDAGYACSRGIPTPMFGPGVRRFGADMTEPEGVLVSDCQVAAAALRMTIDRLCR